jgi:hypothetical protein
MKARFTDLGGYTPFASTPAELRKFIADDVEKWAKVIRAANINGKIGSPHDKPPGGCNDRCGSGAGPKARRSHGYRVT